MADWIDVDRFATSLPEVSLRTAKDGIRQWRVKDKPVAWERPLRQADYEAFGDSAPSGAILGVRTPDLIAKEALISSDPEIISRLLISTGTRQSWFGSSASLWINSRKPSWNHGCTRPRSE